MRVFKAHAVWNFSILPLIYCLFITVNSKCWCNELFFGSLFLVFVNRLLIISWTDFNGNVRKIGSNFLTRLFKSNLIFYFEIYSYLKIVLTHRFFNELSFFAKYAHIIFHAGSDEFMPFFKVLMLSSWSHSTCWKNLFILWISVKIMLECALKQLISYS